MLLRNLPIALPLDKLESQFVPSWLKLHSGSREDENVKSLQIDGQWIPGASKKIKKNIYPD